MKICLPFLLLIMLSVGCGKNEPAVQVDTVPEKQKKISEAEPVPIPEDTPDKAQLVDSPGKKDLLGGLIDLGTDIVKTADDIGQAMFGLTAKEQVEIGRRLHDKLKTKHRLHRDPQQLARIQRLAKPLLKKMKRKNLELTFHILDLKEVNAFCHVGGYIYFNRGLLDIIETDAELQFVIGHEIAHLELGHCEKPLTVAVRAKGLGDELGGVLGAEVAETIAGMAYQALAAGYSEDQELACDAWSYRGMRQTGCTHVQCLAMSRKFLEREKGEPEEKPENPVDRVALEVDNHFRTHPPARKRLDALEKLKD